MEYSEILNKWAEYTNYNPEQTSFNLANHSYELHKVNENISNILKTYDETGALGIIQAKSMFKKILKKSSYNAYEYMKNPNIIKNEKEMWDVFYSDEVLEIENSYINAVNELTDKIIGKILIGERNNEEVLDDLFNATDIVLNSLDKCNKDLFISGGEILPITKISTHIHLFETLAECLTALENTDDGLYLCYINCGGTADGYFGFFLKNNGNLLSINERIDEAYSGQHSHSRNGRWAESKKYELFPYNYIFNYTEHDYKGYAAKHLIDDEKLAFFELGSQVYLPIIIAMIMISKQYMGKTLDMDVKYVDSLFSCNLKRIEESSNKLMIVNNSSLINTHNSLDLSFDLEKIMSGDYAKEFNYSNNKNKHYTETGTFINSNQMFVDLWGKGFSYEASKIYETDSILRIANNTSQLENIPPEFIGTEQRIRLQGYYQLRKQLADYIRDKIHEEWVAFGKTPTVIEWYLERIRNNMDKIEEYVVNEFLRIQSGEEALRDGWHTKGKDSMDIYYVEQKYPDGWNNIILNERKDKWGRECLCEKTGTGCSLFFTFAPKDYKQLELLCGCEVPKIVKGWNYDGHFGDGNSILDATDMVSQVGTPFERHEVNRYKKLYNEHSNVGFNFKVSIGYSKRGLNQLLKKFKSI